MRDKARIKRILGKIEKLWDKYPDMRMGQLLENYEMFPRKGLNHFILWFQEDDELEKKLDEVLKTCSSKR